MVYTGSMQMKILQSFNIVVFYVFRLCITLSTVNNILKQCSNFSCTPSWYCHYLLFIFIEHNIVHSIIVVPLKPLQRQYIGIAHGVNDFCNSVSYYKLISGHFGWNFYSNPPLVALVHSATSSYSSLTTWMPEFISC